MSIAADHMLFSVLYEYWSVPDTYMYKEIHVREPNDPSVRVSELVL